MATRRAVKKAMDGDSGHWIAGAIKHPGALHRTLGVPEGQKIPAAKMAEARGRVRKAKQRAHGGAMSIGMRLLSQRLSLASTLKGLHH
jgi:hypothetical protein